MSKMSDKTIHDDDSLPFDFDKPVVNTEAAVAVRGPAAVVSADQTDEERMDAFFDEGLKEEMDGLGSLRLPRVSVPAAGGLAFELPSGDPDRPDVKQELVGVILYHHPINRLYLRAMDQTSAEEGETNAPDCASDDGVTGTPLDNQPHSDYGGACKDCPMNVYGSGRGGSGKMCSNRHKLMFLADGQTFPWVLDVTPTSLKKIREYIQNLLIITHRRSWSVTTSVSLRKVKNADGVAYSELQFKMTNILPPPKALEMKELGDSLRAAGL